MNKNTLAAIISLIFLAIYTYGMYSFQAVSFNTTLPLLGPLAFNFNDYGQQFVAIGLALAFILFLIIRREESEDDSSEATR